MTVFYTAMLSFPEKEMENNVILKQMVTNNP